MAKKETTKKKSVTSATETLGQFISRQLEDGSEEFNLPSGAVCVKQRFTARDSKRCIKISGSDEDLMMDAIIAETCTFDGKKITMEDIPEMDGMDYMLLLGKLSGVR